MLKKIRFWPNATSILNNEDGAVIIAALMILVLLTIIGIASNNVSNTEVKIATHEAIHQMNLYCAEGTASLALEEMEDLVNPKSEDPSWLWQSTDSDSVFTPFEADMALEGALWEGNSFEYEVEGTVMTITPDSIPETVDETILSDSRYLVNYRGILPGEPLEIGVTKRYRYDIYGRCAPANRGAVTVEIGYIKAF
jgi:hypothetical protein